MQEMWVQSLGWEESLEKEMATHSSVPIWEIPWTEKPGGLQLTGSLKELDTNEVTEHACIITEFLKKQENIALNL